MWSADHVTVMPIIFVCVTSASVTLLACLSMPYSPLSILVLACWNYFCMCFQIPLGHYCILEQVPLQPHSHVTRNQPGNDTTQTCYIGAAFCHSVILKWLLSPLPVPVPAGLPSPHRPADATCGLPCDDLCVQEGLTFRCECNPGRELQSDGISCRGMQEQVYSYSGYMAIATKSL